MRIEFIKKRSWDIVEFDPSRIISAIQKAYLSIGDIEISDIPNIVNEITKELETLQEDLLEGEFLNVEIVQDQVEKWLMKSGKFEVAKSYIVYRQEHKKIRETELETEIKKIENHSFKITKSDWSEEFFDKIKLENFYNQVCLDLTEKCPFSEIRYQLKMYLIEWINTNDILKLLTKSAINLISIKNTTRQYVASRIESYKLYKQASQNRNISLEQIYKPESFLALFEKYVKDCIYYKDFFNYYSPEDILKAWEMLNPNQDKEYNYTTILMLRKRYLLNPNWIVRELPQEMYMSIALFLAIPEKKEFRLTIAIEIYKQISTQKISLPTPTLMNARTNFHQLSSCFKLNADDDLRSIYHNIENMAQISKFGGGIGAYLWNIRSKWAEIRWIKWASWWVIPRVKVINDTAIAVNQLWARAWAISVTLDIRHRDVQDFLDIQTETGDIRRKSFDIFPAVSVPDLFMQRVLDNWNRTFFDPKEIEKKTWKKLQDLFWDQFNSFYQELENDNEITLKETIPAKDLFKKFLKTVVETGMPYVFFRDTVNKSNPNRHAWNIYSTQLCTEIAQNTSPSKFIEETEENWQINIKYTPWDSVVCNLASINIAKVYKPEDIQESIPIAMRILDNVITLNFYPIKEAELTAMKYRSVWLGFLGLSEYLATHNMMYDSAFAREHVDNLFESYAYETLNASNELAQERWKYPLFDWSDWSKWILFGKNEEWFANHSQIWNERKSLIENIKKTWLRFSYHLSPAPNTSTSLVVWTTAGLLPIYKKYFVETNSIAPSVNVAPWLNSENMRYYKEYINMKMPDVIDMISVIQKWIDQAISFERIINPAEVSPAELYSYYIKAREQWIKTVYYVRSMSLDVKECSSCSW